MSTEGQRTPRFAPEDCGPGGGGSSRSPHLHYSIALARPVTVPSFPPELPGVSWNLLPVPCTLYRYQVPIPGTR